MQDGKKYMLWVVTKLYINETYVTSENSEEYVPQDMLIHPANEQKSFRYSITGRPRGVSVYSQYAAPMESNPVNHCAVDSNSLYGGCQHICVPKDTASSGGKERVCQCGIGYTLQKPQAQGCYPDIQSPPYLVFADVDHGLIFQMSLVGDQEAETEEEIKALAKKS